MKNKYLSIIHILFFPIILAGIVLAGCASRGSPDEDKEVLAWTHEALMTTFTYDYANYRQQLEAASQYFTPQTWQKYFIALNASSSFRKVVNRRLVVSAVAQGAPVIVSEGVNVNSQPYWKVQIPMLISYENNSTHIQKPVIVTAGILRTNNEIGVRGYAINELLVRDQDQLETEDSQSK